MIARSHSLLGRICGHSALMVVLTAMYLPVIVTFLYSFNDSRVGTVWTGFSTRGYRELWRERGLWEGLEASSIIGAVAATASVFAATLAALGLKQWRRTPRAVAQGLFTVPLVTPDIILAIALAIFFQAIRFEKGWTTVVLGHCVFGIPFAYVMVASAVVDLDETLYAAALDCGATPWQAYWRITAPLLAPSLIVAWFFVFALSFDDFLVTFLTKGAGADTLPIKVYAQLRFGVKPQTSALFVVLFLATLIVAVIGWRLNKTRSPLA